MSRNKWRAAACASGVVLCRMFASAQTAAPAPLPSLERPAIHPGPPLTMAAAIEEAFRKNAALAVARKDAVVARQHPAESRFLPPPALNAQIWQWPVNTLDPRNTNMFMFTVEQDIPGRGKRDLRAAAAQREAEVSTNGIGIAAQQTIAEVEHAYVALFVARRAADWYAETAATMRQLADAAQIKYAAGRTPQYDALKPIAELSKLYDDALATREQAELAAAQLNVAMGRAVDEAIGPLEEPASPGALPSLSSLVSLALDQQPQIQASRLAIERARADLALARSDARPDFMLSGGYMLTPRGTDAWTGQFGITWPAAPWSRGRLDARVAASAATVAAGEARLQAVESQVRLSVQQAYAKTAIAGERAALLRTTIVPQAREALDAARIGYEADRIDLLTVLESQRSLLGAQLDSLRVLGELADARADLERAVGIPLDSAESMTGRGR